jgi:hypothetical protein
MSLSLYAFSIPLLTTSLGSLSAILKKAQSYAQENKIEETVLTSGRLYPDMFPLSRQVQIACDMSKGCGARLAGVENPGFADTETSFDELLERVKKTIDFLESLSESEINASANKAVKFKAGPAELEFVGENYVREWVYPNFYFHLTTAYNILRHNGLAIGKLDYLGIEPQA